MTTFEDQDSAQANELLFDFDLWSDLHSRHSAINHPSELHGLLTGELAAGERLSSERWEDLALEHLGCDQILEQMGDDQPTPRALLHGFYATTLAALQSDNMDFRLLMPAESSPLGQRLEALGTWVRGFLEGMARAAGDALSRAPDDIRELMQDFVAITQVEVDADDSEDGEREFEEITEYVRIGVLNIFAEFNRPEPDERTLH